MSLRLESFHVYLPSITRKYTWSEREDDEFRPSEQDLEQMVMGNGFHYHSDTKYGWGKGLTGCAMDKEFFDCFEWHG